MDPADRGSQSGKLTGATGFNPGGALLLCLPDASPPACGPGAPAPSGTSSPRPANRNRRDVPASEKAKADVRRNHHTKADVVVTVVRMVVVAVVRAREALIVVPGAPAQNTRPSPGATDRFPGDLHRTAKNFRRASRGISVQRPSGSEDSGPELSVSRWETKPPHESRG